MLISKLIFIKIQLCRKVFAAMREFNYPQSSALVNSADT